MLTKQEREKAMLETKIEKLTDAIERLIEVMAGQQTLPLAAPEKQEVESKPSAPVANSDKPSRDRLQAMCLELVKQDRANKARITELVGKYSNGGKLLKDIADDSLAAFLADLEAL
jgi:hypothetical protein